MYEVLYHRIIVVLYHRTILLLPLAALSCCQHSCVMALWYFGMIVLWQYGVVVIQYYSIISIIVFLGTLTSLAPIIVPLFSCIYHHIIIFCWGTADLRRRSWEPELSRCGSHRCRNCMAGCCSRHHTSRRPTSSMDILPSHGNRYMDPLYIYRHRYRHVHGHVLAF